MLKIGNSIGAIFFLLAASVHAQNVGTGFQGTVTDPSGGVIAAAKVTITDSSTGVSHAVTTSADGRYEVLYLVPGTYTIAVEAGGFRTERRTDINLVIGQLARINFQLTIGAVTEAIDVKGAAVLLNTQDSSIGEVVQPDTVVNLPLNGRVFASLAGLNAGVQVSADPATGDVSMSANGVRDNNLEVTIGGATIMDHRDTFVAVLPSVDAIQEFQVQTGNYSAEYGYNAGANISVQLKSGTNALHGTLFEFMRNSVLDARDYFNPAGTPQVALRRNQFGGVITGPIKRDKTFFMVSYEGQRFLTASNQLYVVPTPAERSGNFQGLGSPITDPNNGGAPFPNNIIPASRLNPVALNLDNLYMPLPNTPGSLNYTAAPPTIANQDQIMARGDQFFGAHDQAFAQVIYQNRNLPYFDANPHFPGNVTWVNYEVGAQEVHTFSASMLNEVRFSWREGNWRRTLPYGSAGFNDCQTLDICGMQTIGGPGGAPVELAAEGVPQIDINGYLGMGDRATSGWAVDLSQTYQFVDNFSIIRGGHSLRVGFDTRLLIGDASTSNVPEGNLVFTQDLTGDAMSEFLLGYPTTIVTPEGVPVDAIHQWMSGIYAQDDWKISRRFTLNLGIRDDIYAMPDDQNNILRTLRWDLGTPTNPILWPIPGQGGNYYVNHPNNISPRVGFAYQVKNDMVVRGGWGIFHQTSQFDNLNILQLSPPVSGGITLSNPFLNPVATLQNPVPGALIPAQVPYNVSTMPPDRQHYSSYYENWNMQVSKSIGSNNTIEFGYLGTRGIHLDTSFTNYNSPTPGPGDIQPRRPYPEWGRIREMTTLGNSIYDAFRVRYEHRTSHGLNLTATYVHSHLIDDTEGSTNGTRAQAQDAYNTGKAERGNGAADLHDQFIAGLTYALPGAGLKGAFSKAVLGGWTISGIITLQAGLPIFISQNGDSENNDDDAAGGANLERPNLVAGQNATLSNRTYTNWFNTAAFTRAIYQYGNTPRNPAGLYGPGLYNADLALIKQWKVRERHQIQFRAETFNTLNTPHLAGPDGSLGDDAFGQCTYTANNNRQIQIALKYMF